MISDMIALDREQVDLLPARTALGLVDVNVDTVVQVPVNLAIALLGANATAIQGLAGISG